MERYEEIKMASCSHWSNALYKEEVEKGCVSETAMARKIALRAFSAGAEWADSHPKNPWISVKEQLPEESDWVFVAGGKYGYTCLFYCKGKFYSDFSIGTYDSSITHWMPIVEPK